MQKLHSVFEYVDINILMQYLNIYTISFVVFMIILKYVWRKNHSRNKIISFFNNIWLFIVLPGTFVHELMHLFIGIFLRAKPRGFSILPKKAENGGYVLGSVKFININSFNVLPVAMAPILMLPLSLFVLTNYDYILLSSIEMKMLSGYILYNLWSSSIPSIVDFGLLFKFPLTLFFYAIIFYSFYKIL